MARFSKQALLDTNGAHLVLYDGVCGLCSRLIQFLLVHDRRCIFHFASLQSGVGRALVKSSGFEPDTIRSFYVITNYHRSDAKVFAKGRAALFIASTIGWPWRAMCMFGILPSAWLDSVYDSVARNRYRIFGRHERCLLPRPEYQNRFLDGMGGNE